MREYKYRGYKFFATPNFLSVSVHRFDKWRDEIRPVYHIEGLKDATAKPYLTSLNQCKDYIDYQISIAKRRESDGGERGGKVPSQNQ